MMPRRLPLPLLVAVALTSPAASALALSPGGMGAAGAVSAACRPPSLPAAAEEDGDSELLDQESVEVDLLWDTTTLKVRLAGF